MLKNRMKFYRLIKYCWSSLALGFQLCVHTKDPAKVIIGHVVSNLYGTEIEIWACFGLVGNTEKNWADYEGKEKLDISLKINCDF